VLRLAPGLRASLDVASEHVRAVVRNFVPVFVSRGVVQISGYIDANLSSLVGQGAVTVFANAQALYLLPGSLFGMSISAAELPAMSSLLGSHDEVCGLLRTRLCAGLRRIAYFIVPSAAAFIAVGDVLASALFRYGRFSHADAVWVWGTLAGSSVGLLASTMGRLYSSAFYALRDTRTPLRFALVRVGLTLGLGYLFALYLPGALGIDRKWGTAGLTASAGMAGWVEFTLLRRALNRRIGNTGLPLPLAGRLWLSALLAAVAGWSTNVFLPHALPALPRAVVVCAIFGLVYLAATTLLDVSEGATLARRVLGRVRRARPR
jgi:putative peptidoglycan lipid II flippase